MESTSDTLAQFDLGPFYQEQVGSGLSHKTSFSVDWTFALLSIEMSIDFEIRNESFHLTNLKTAAIKKLDYPDQSASFAFCRAHDDRLLRARVAGRDFRIDILRVGADLTVSPLERVATFRDSLSGSHAVQIMSLEQVFLVKLREANKFEIYDQPLDTELIVADSLGKWHKIQSKQYKFLKKAIIDQINYHNGCVSWVDSSHRDIREFWGDNAAHSEDNLLVKLNCRKQKLFPVRFKQIFEDKTLQSQRFRIVMVESSTFQLVNSRNDKRGCAAQIRADDSEMTKYFGLDGRICRSHFYLQDAGQVHRFDISSGKPLPLCVITANSESFGLDRFDRFSAQLLKKRFLVLKRKKPIAEAVRQNLEIAKRSSQLRSPSTSDFEINLETKHRDMLGLHSVNFDKASRTMHLLFMLRHSYESDSDDLEFRLAITSGELRLESVLSVDHSFERDADNESGKFILLAFDLETKAVHYQLVRSTLTLFSLNFTGDNLLFVFDCMGRDIESIQKASKLTFSTGHLNDCDRLEERDFFSGILAVPKQLTPLSTQPRQVLQSSQRVDCESLLVAILPSNPKRQPTRYFFQRRRPGQLL